MNDRYSRIITPRYVAAGAAYASSTTITDVNPTPNLVIPANLLEPGDKLHVRARGKFSNTGTPTLILGVYWGAVAGTVLCDIGATTTTTGATNWAWEIDVIIQVRTIGATGSMVAWGHVKLGTSLTAVTIIPMDNAAIAAVSVDTTAAKALTIGATWSASSASNTLTCEDFEVEHL